jgi:hypothetical protein
MKPLWTTDQVVSLPVYREVKAWLRRFGIVLRMEVTDRSDAARTRKRKP